MERADNRQRFLIGKRRFHFLVGSEDSSIRGLCLTLDVSYFGLSGFPDRRIQSFLGASKQHPALFDLNENP